ncbi:hypothetical protein GCM10011390_17930 [Aureimonas endophytica]|uniref:Uncharacterized protein n=1 Tax=Aureimonas endophytica TaxID=2027858 RepID=A0A916ZIH4_9HYPH|nr:hypothetical protein [Aureimonas endophytica]GGD99516.1 hypothetical protein GCM10011390_17930 [Aureimonas endophytica]
MNLRKMRAATALGVVLAGLGLSGCLGPTYGTGKSAGAQLFSDIDGMLALGPKERDEIDYSPRAELVRPKDKSVLPAPQASVDAASGGKWPESPEQRRARIRAAADARDTGGVVQPGELLADKEGVTEDEKARNTWAGARQNQVKGILTPDELKSGREGFMQRLAESKQGSPTTRKYLSEPPIAYRQPSSSAPVGDPGEDEDVKQKRIDGKDETFLSKLKSLNPF